MSRGVHQAGCVPFSVELWEVPKERVYECERGHLSCELSRLAGEVIASRKLIHQGIPDQRELVEGDIINLDVSLCTYIFLA